VGGAPFWAARALRVLGTRAMVVAKCADGDRRLLAPPLLALGLPVLWRTGSTTAGFSFRYDGDRREMTVDALGDAWTPEDVRGVAGARWVHAGALARSDFPADTLAELARERHVSLDGQGLVRPARTGPLELDADYDPEVLRHVSILKLAEEEARALVGEPDEDGLRSLGVSEVVVTLGSRGSIVLAGGRLEHVAARPVEGRLDPTGAGDAFAAAYLVSRAGGHAPAAAARRATALVSGLLGRRLR
jgi:sugar/nucleoside kinase (ribokinase family)